MLGHEQKHGLGSMRKKHGLDHGLGLGHGQRNVFVLVHGLGLGYGQGFANGLGHGS